MGTWKKVTTSADDSTHKNDNITFAQLFTGLDTADTAAASQILKVNSSHDGLEWSSDAGYTDAEARLTISVTDNGEAGSLAYNNSTGVISYTGATKAELDVDHLITLSGVSAAANNLGDFSGSTITSDGTVKAGMQELETSLELKSPLASPTFTGTVAIPNYTNVETTLGGIATNATAIALKSPIASPTFTGTVVLPNVPAIVTTQLDLKSNLASPTFTGTVAIPNYSDVEDTLDGIATNATAIALKAPIASPTLTGAVSLTSAASSDASWGMLMQDTAGTGAVKYRTPAQVLSDIGAAAKAGDATGDFAVDNLKPDNDIQFQATGKGVVCKNSSSAAGFTLKVQAGTANASNNVGGALTISGGQPVGTGAGGAILFEVYKADAGGGSGVVNTSAVSAMTIASSGDITAHKNFTVSGTTTTINTETIELADNKILLNSNASGTPNENGGIEVERGSRSNTKMLWDETNHYWSTTEYDSSANDTNSAVAMVATVERGTGTGGSIDIQGKMYVNTSTGKFYVYT